LHFLLVETRRRTPLFLLTQGRSWSFPAQPPDSATDTAPGQSPADRKQVFGFGGEAIVAPGAPSSVARDDLQSSRRLLGDFRFAAANRARLSPTLPRPASIALPHRAWNLRSVVGVLDDMVLEAQVFRTCDGPPEQNRLSLAPIFLVPGGRADDREGGF
jgi:hypothetical protein